MVRQESQIDTNKEAYLGEEERREPNIDENALVQCLSDDPTEEGVP